MALSLSSVLLKTELRLKAIKDYSVVADIGQCIVPSELLNIDSMLLACVSRISRFNSTFSCRSNNTLPYERIFYDCFQLRINGHELHKIVNIRQKAVVPLCNEFERR